MLNDAGIEAAYNAVKVTGSDPDFTTYVNSLSFSQLIGELDISVEDMVGMTTLRDDLVISGNDVATLLRNIDENPSF